MLKSWSIENFKPIVNSGELKLAPVTILAGRNSSGKSSLLQSILMIAQTLSNQVPDRALLPNERIVQLGTFEDILSDFSGSRTITVGFQLDFETEQASTSFESDPFLENESDVTSVRTIAIFNSASGNGTSSSAIEAAKVVVEKVSIEIDATQLSIIGVDGDQDLSELKHEISDIKIYFTIKKLSEDQLLRFLEKVESDYLRFIPHAGEQPNYIGNFENQNEKTHEPVLVALSHFLPISLVRKFKAEERRLRVLRRSLKRAVIRLLEATNDEVLAELIQQYSNLFNPKTPISEDMRADIQKFCEERHIAEKFSGQTISQLIVWANSLIPSLEKRSIQRGRKFSTMANDLRELLLQYIYSIMKEDLEGRKDVEGLEIFVNDSEVENISQAVTKLTRFFTSKIRYLGPLRADPQASQKFAPSSELDDVGQKGEYSAAVYDANQEARIEWFNPFSKQIERSTLKVALDNWARYLDVANLIRIETAGQSGFSWQVVHKEGQKALPLSAVGVGVSQVLPILVMGLLAPANTLLIIEQPELHLHANVQARLGDFFVGLSKCKKQCMIETHSENLVSQLRYHIVQSGGQDKSDCMIYFVDQDEKGAAKFERIEISARGNILNWPSGFFDESMHQEDKITAASIRRRAKLAKND